MSPSDHVSVRIDLARVRQNAQQVAASTEVPVIAVVKADAYGLGGKQVAQAIADVVDGFYVFELAEAVEYALGATGRSTIALLGGSSDPNDYLAHRVRPVVWSIDRAAALRSARPVLSIDTGQRRFGVPADDADLIARLIAAGEIDEAFTHATSVDQAELLQRVVGGTVKRLHAAGSALLGERRARLDAVRPGLALYQGVAHVSARLVDVRDSQGPAGYTGFVVERHGLILAGYAHGLRPGPCRLNGHTTRVLEVGMQSAFIECAAHDRVGDDVVVLGDGLTETDVGLAWGTTPQLALTHLAGLGRRTYLEV